MNQVDSLVGETGVVLGGHIYIYIYIFFSAIKIENFIWNKFNTFDIFAQSIDCGYLLEYH